MKSLCTITLLIILFSLTSCKDGNKKNILEKTKGIDKETVTTPKPTPKTYIYKAKINTKSGLFLRKENNTKSESITKIPFNTVIGIIAFTNKFETIKSNKKYNYYGKWVEVEYLQENGNYITGFVFDDFLDYQFKKNHISSNTKDTVTVTNEKEFVNALSSNRVIWIDTNIINLEKYIKNNNIDPFLIIDPDSEEEINFNYETHLVSGYFSSFGLYGFRNLEIRGKDKKVGMVVNDHDAHIIDFYNCNNILIDNINFYHKGNFIGACGGEVVTYENCSNFNFQNSHFDGSGSVGSLITNSSNFNFLNCEFYNNTQNAIILNSSKKININRTDFHDNKLYELFKMDIRVYENTTINLLNSYFKKNEIYKDIFNVINNPEEGQGGGTLNININNCNIEQNIVGKTIFNLSETENLNISIENSNIIENTSDFNDFIIKNTNYSNLDIVFKNTIISNNIDFYAFLNEVKNNINEENFTNENIFNTASDSTLTKFNTYKKDSIQLCFRNLKDLTYNEKTKQLSRKKYLLEGLHRIKIGSNKKYFLELPVEFGSSFIGEGNIINGKLEDLWEIKFENGRRNKYFATYSNGILNGRYEELVLVNPTDNKKKYNYKYQLIIKGEYKEGKKDGIWKHYFKDGNLQKEITYSNGEITGPFLFYFPSGKLREKRTDLENKNGESICYYPNGETESIITYVDSKIEISKSTFFDINGKNKKAIEIKSNWKKDDTQNPLDFTNSKYKNKVHIYYSEKTKQLLGYTYYQNGKPYNLSKSLCNKHITTYQNLPLKTMDNDFEVTYYDDNYNASKKNASLIYDKQNNLKYFSFIDENQLITNYKYDGLYNLMVKLNQYKFSTSKVTLHGISKEYSSFGLLNNNSSKIYKDGIPQKD